MALNEKELVDFRVQCEAWFKENKPAEPDFLLPQSFMEVSNERQFDFLCSWQQKVYEAGYLGAAWPKEYGGGSAQQELQDIATSIMARENTPIIVNTIGLNWAGPLILNMGSEAQKKKYIKGILSCEDVWCQGFSEPDHGSDLGNAQLKAVAEGNGYKLNGSKIWTTLGEYAKYMILLARTNPNAPNKYDGLSFFLSPMQIEGVEVVQIQKLTGEYGFNQVFFSDAKVPADCLFGEEGEGWKVAMATLAFERGAKGGQAGGHASSMSVTGIADVIELARRVKRNGRPAIEDSYIRDSLVQFMIEERSFHLNSARNKHKSLISERPASISMSKKLITSEFFRRLNQFAVKLQGANAAYYTGDESACDNGKWHRNYMNAFSATIGGGTTQIQYNILGERILGLPK